MSGIKLLVFGDSHIGFDYAVKPKIKRPRRGNDFIDNFNHLIGHTIKNNFDILIHLGDVFNRSKPPAVLVDLVFNQFKKVCEAGIPVIIVPGNHERSFLALSLFGVHERLKIFTKPDSLNYSIKGIQIGFSGFPFFRGDIRSKFNDIIEELKINPGNDINLLLMHHAIDGAQVGIQNYTFKSSEDVIDIASIPGKFDLVMSGHIHRTQHLFAPSGADIIYPGSIERTSFVEREEKKGFYEIFVNKSDQKIITRFEELPVRNMYSVTVTDKNKEKLLERLEHIPQHSTLQLVLPSGYDGAVYEEIKNIEREKLWDRDIMIEYSFRRKRNSDDANSP
ncbi:MAG: hypothetical protein SCALA702_31410 [Melioribacteraceae bacterium]|nr:MAG: hypothetical protein SCALA702_31410 [Melioribacteraceae bacterium]